MKLDSKAEPHWILDLVMGTIRGTIVCLCISFLAISWPGESLGAPTSVLPLLKQYYTSDIDSQQSSPGISSSNCNSYVRSSTSQIPNSAAQRQQLLNQATILLEQLSASAPTDTSVSIDPPCNQAIEHQERILLQNLINRLGAFKKNSIVAANPSSSLPAISEATYNSITNHYLHIRLLTLDLLNPEDVQIVQPALDTLYKTFVKIITGQLLNVELPNLCSATLTLNTQLKATDAPLELQEEVTHFIRTLTAALTGQSQVTILGLCDCLNDLETSVVTVVEHDKSQKLQYLLSHLVEAVTNAVVSGGDVGCNIIDIVQRYVVSIKQAVQEDARVRARQIYSSVLSFEEELYKVLLASKPIAIEVPSSSQNRTSSNLETEEFYLSEIERLSEEIFGNRRNLVESAVKILLNIKKSEDPSPEDESTSSDPSKATLASLKKIADLLKSVHLHPRTDSTHVVEAIVEELSPLPQTDVQKVLNALDPVLEDSNDTDKLDDATAIVDNGGFLIIKEQLVQETDAQGNVVDIVQGGVYNLVDPETNVTWSGNYEIQDEVIQSGPNESIYVKRSGVYDVNEPQNDSSTPASPRVKRHANFEVERITVPQVDPNGNSEVTENGTYTLTDPDTGISKSGNFVVENIVSKSNPDGSIETIKSAIVYVDKPGATSPSKQPSLEPGTGYFLFDEHRFESPDSDGNYGNGVYNIKNPVTNEYVTGTYTIQETNRTKNPDGSVDLKTSGLIYVDGVIRDPSSDNFDIVLYVVNGSKFTFNDHIVYVTDVNGNVSPIITGGFGETDPSTGITRVGNYIVQSIITTENPDGSTDITKFGRFSDINFVAPSTDPSTKSSKSSEPIESPGSASTKHLPLSQDSFQALVNRLNPAVTPVHPGTSPSTDDPTHLPLQPVPDAPSTTSPDLICHDATSIVSNGTTFIINQLITPVLDAEGNVIDKITMGTYHFMDIRTNISWSGAFDVEDSSIQTISSSKTKVTASGILDVPSTEDDCDSKIIAKFSIEGELNVYVDKSGAVKISEEGTYSLTDPTTGATKTGTFVVENTVSKSQPGGVIEFTNSGLLFVDESDATSLSPVEQPLVPGYNGYFLFEGHILNSPDSHGNHGSGLYSIKDPRTNEYLTGTYVIEKASTTNNPDGTIDMKTEGVIYVGDFDPNFESSSSLSPAIIRNGARFTFNDHLEYVTDTYGHVGLIGHGRSTQVDPETGVTQFGKYVIFNVVKTKDSGGSTNVRKFGVLPIYDDCEPIEDPVGTTPAPTHSSSTTQAPMHSSSTTHASTGSSGTTQAPEYSTSTTDAPTGSSGTTQAPEYSTSTTDAPTGSSGTTQAPEYSTSTSHAATDSPCTTQTPTYSTSTTRAPTSHPHKPYILKTDVFEALVNSLNPIKPTRTSPGQTPGTQDEDVGNVNENPINDPTAIVTDGAYFIIDGQVVPQLNAEGNTVGLLKTGSYSIRDSRTNNSWSGSFEVEDCSIESNTDGQIDVTGSGRFDVTLPDSYTTNSKNQAIFSITDLVSVVVDEMGTSRATENGTYRLTNPTTGDSTYGTFVVENSLSKMNPDGCIDLVKSGTLYVDKPHTTSPNNQPSSINYGGYFLTDQHLLAVPDSDGNYGTGVYNIKDPKTNEYTSGTYVIQEASIVNNTDGTTDVTTKGLIYVDSSRSSSPSTSSEPSLAIMNGAQFTFVDHLSYVTDAYGRVNVVGTGVFTQTDPKTNTSRSGKYIIQDIVNVNNPDGSQDGIESGIFYYTTDSDSSTDPSATTPKLGSDETLTELNGYLKALFNSLDVLKTQKKETSKVAAKTSEPTFASVSGSGITPDYVVLPRSNVVSAINGQCLSAGDIVIVQTNSGTALLATIRDSYSPVIFYVTNLPDLTGKCATANRVWTIPEYDFSKQDRSLFATVLKSGNQPCQA